MRKLILSMQMTLDGFVAGPNSEMDWIIAGNEVWKELFKDLRSVDTMLLGKNMYPGYSQYWQSVLSNPSSEKNEKEFAQLADRTPHIVFSKSMQTADWKNTRISRNAEKDVAALKKEKGGDMILWGGASLAFSLAKVGLIDEYRITLNPTLLGSGLSLFNNLQERRSLTLKDSRQLEPSMVLLRYVAKGK